ncbi:organomercurial lyase [Mumia flava]|uniref:organomercurial lyase n=1 Tax=Mumia flava TaxID=1348852 RepID=UPI000A723597|nr:organomercurial lyase [Mumia flava]
MDVVDVEDVRVAVYERLATVGRVPSPAELAARLGRDESEIVHALGRLADAHHLVLDEHGAVVMAHPFSAVPLGFAVMGDRTLWWGGCAWDSFALPHLVGPSMPDLLIDGRSVLVSTRCPACGTAHAWNVDTQGPPPGDHVAHFLVPTARMWDDVVHTCSHQRIFCARDCVDRWLADTGNDLGYVMDLPTLWRFARGWYAGRLDRGYERREPAQAADYFRSVGLTGSFWGLDA